MQLILGAFDIAPQLLLLAQVSGELLAKLVDGGGQLPQPILDVLHLVALGPHHFLRQLSAEFGLRSLLLRHELMPPAFDFLQLLIGSFQLGAHRLTVAIAMSVDRHHHMPGRDEHLAFQRDHPGVQRQFGDHAASGAAIAHDQRPSQQQLRSGFIARRGLHQIGG